MYCNYLKNRSFFFAISFLFLHLVSAQQKKTVELRGADVMRYDEAIGKGLRLLIGNVKLKHGNAVMFCDSAVQNELENSFDAFGNVHIIQGDTLNTWGDVLYYNGNKQEALLRNNVKMENKGTVLTTQKLDYDLANSVGRYIEGGKIVDSINVLTSIQGEYFSKQNKIYFKKDVVATNPDYRIVSDTMAYNTTTKVVDILGPTTMYNDSSTLYSELGWYNTQIKYANLKKNSWAISKQYKMKGDLLYLDRLNEVGEGFGNVEMIDTLKKVILAGNYCFFDEKGDKTYATDSALLVLYDKTDSLFLHADTLRAITDTLDQKIFLAYNHVRFYRLDMQGKCDSLSYCVSDSTIRMYQKPILWSDKSQLLGDFVEVFTENNRPVKLDITENAFVINREDSIHFNQIKGTKISGFIENNKLRKIFADGNAESLYFSRDGDYIIGMNKTNSSYLTIFFENGKADKIIMNPSPEGTLAPPHLLKLSDKLLEGFTWHANIRPKSKRDIYRIETTSTVETK